MALVACVFDTSGSMAESQKFNIGKKFIEYLSNLILKNKKSKLSLINVGGSTSNRLEFQNIAELLPLNYVDLGTIEHMNNELKPGNNSGSIVDAIELAFDILDNDSNPHNHAHTSEQNLPAYSPKSEPSHSRTSEPSDSINNLTSINIDVNSISNLSNKSGTNNNSGSTKYSKIIVIVTDGETAISIDKIRHVERTIIPKLVEAKCNIYVACIGTSAISSNPTDIKTENVLLFQSLASLTGGKYQESDKGGYEFSTLFQGTNGVIQNDVTCATCGASSCSIS